MVGVILFVLLIFLTHELVLEALLGSHRSKIYARGQLSGRTQALRTETLV